MTIRERVPLAPYTSFGVGGPARFYAEAASLDELRELGAYARERRLPIRVLGAGTNILVPDEGVEALVVRIADAGFAFEAGEEPGVERLLAHAGAKWDDLVDAATARGLWGVENLAGIPGLAGGALVQNIGAYGAELASVFASADVLDLSTGVERRIGREEAALAYRSSLFKDRRDLAILSITLALGTGGAPSLAYADLARAAERAPLATPADVARAVRAIRANKFPASGCAGSFFKNPVVSEEKLAELRARYPELPSYAAGAGVKIPLAWLLDHALHLAGYAKGPVRLFERQPLVLVAERGARAGAIDAFAREIEARVHDAFGIAIEREVETFA